MNKLFGSYRFFIGLRYVMSKRRNRFISFISLISALSIALGVTVLITVLSVVNGFERVLTEHLVGMEAEATVIGYDDSLRDWQDVADRAQRHPGISSVAPYVESEGMVTFDRQVKGVVVRGILPEAEPQVSFLPKKNGGRGAGRAAAGRIRDHPRRGPRGAVAGSAGKKSNAGLTLGKNNACGCPAQAQTVYRGGNI